MFFAMRKMFYAIVKHLPDAGPGHPDNDRFHSNAAKCFSNKVQFTYCFENANAHL